MLTLDARTDERPQLLRPQLVALRSVVERNDVEGHTRPQQRGNCGGSLPARLIAVEHEQHAIEVSSQEVRLMPGERRAHEADYRVAGLMDCDGVEEAFDDDHHARFRGNRPMQVEEGQRFAKASRESILRLLAVNRAAAYAISSPVAL
jgi:hypothetical protein